MSLKIDSKYDLDSPERTIQHREIILSKPFLKRIYIDWYSELLRETRDIPEGKKVEIGSGGGFFKEFNDEIITTDVLDLPSVDQIVDACDMPFEDQSLAAIYMINVFHHIPDVEKFLREAERTLKPGGKVAMIEPGNSIWSRFIYKNFHHEMFDENRDWSFPATGPLSGSNQALPYIVFKRDRQIFEEGFPKFELQKFRMHGGFRYLFSGGVSRMQMVPGFMYGPLKLIEELTNPLTGMFQTIVFKRRK